jgi:hypothetical protein
VKLFFNMPTVKERSINKDLFHSIDSGTDFFPQQILQELLNPEKHHRNIKLFLEVNTLPRLDQMSRDHAHHITLGHIPEYELNNLLPHDRYDAVWMMGIWERSPQSAKLALDHLNQYQHDVLPDAHRSDIAGSAFSITGHIPDKQIAPDGWAEVDNLRAQLHHRRTKLFVDLIINHKGLGCEWSHIHPDWFVRGNENLAKQYPADYHKLRANDNQIYWIARGKEFRYEGCWIDTLQLNYANPYMRRALINEWINIAKHVDGFRVDMAALATNDQFLKNWGDLLSPEERKYIEHATEFTSEAIHSLRLVKNPFTQKPPVIIAETYTHQDILKQCGFDYLYAKVDFYNLFERVVGPRNESPQNLYLYLKYLSDIDRQKQVRMTENHDEDRAFSKYGLEPSLAMAVVNTFVANGFYMIQDGQTDGHRIKVPVQLSRTPVEEPNMKVRRFYDHLFNVKNANVFQNGDWSMADRTAVGWGNQTFEAIMPQQFDLPEQGGAVVCTNIRGYDAECHIKLPSGVKHVFVHDLTNNRDLPENQIAHPNQLGMYVKLPPWQTQIVYYSYI